MARVAIITRTKDRPKLLKRAFETLRAQTFREFEWMIVNDGGEGAPVDEIAAASRDGGIPTRVLHNRDSLGMAAAANRGVEKAVSDYCVLLDDDDSWHQDFLQVMTETLDRREGLGGVVCHTLLVVEKFDKSGSIKVLRTWPRYCHLRKVTLADLARRNLFTTNSFLFRKTAWESVGRFNEQLPVLDDWDFNLRFTQCFEIGVVPQRLANYHKRYREKAAYGNTISVDRLRDAFFEASIRNHYLRIDIRENKQGLGFLLAQGELSKPLALFEDGLMVLLTCMGYKW